MRKVIWGKAVTVLFGAVFLLYVVAHAYAPALPIFATVTPLRFFLGFFALWAVVFLALQRAGFMD